MSNSLSRKARRVATFGGVAASLIPVLAIADGLVVDRIYDPYVQPMETEFEWRSIIQSDDELGDPQKHSFGVGRGLSDRWATELYVIGTKTNGDSISVDAFELEAKWQLTEQGEFAVDWGSLVISRRSSASLLRSSVSSRRSVMSSRRARCRRRRSGTGLTTVAGPSRGPRRMWWPGEWSERRRPPRGVPTWGCRPRW